MSLYHGFFDTEKLVITYYRAMVFDSYIQSLGYGRIKDLTSNHGTSRESGYSLTFIVIS